MKFVLAISIGPVAHFIAAGRRSRDLWYGSTWLSKTTSHVAAFLQRQPGVEMLLSPTKERLSFIEQQETQKHGARVSNKILALVEPSDPQTYLHQLAAKCRGEAREFLIQQLQQIPRLVKNDDILHRKALQAQIEAIRQGDFIEFAAAWTPVSEGNDAFGGAVGRACELRDRIPKLFVHPSFSQMGIARSDLDEGRDTVLCPETQKIEIRQARAKLGLIESEELDAIGLLRRLSPHIDKEKLPALPFPPVTRVAVDAWLEGCATSPKANPILRDLQCAMKKAQREQGEFFHIWCTPSDEPNAENPRFPYESSVLLENGCDALRKSVERTIYREGPWAAIDAALREVNKLVQKLHGIVGLPIPYYAFIEMDGDGIGNYLASQRTKDAYQDCVKRLDAFAEAAKKDVEERGTAFYVAADELAAYVPLDKALDVVKHVVKLFDENLPRKTISAGVVFAHARDDLRGVRQAARDALEKAKNARKNARSEQGYVCLREMPRAGSDRETIGSVNEIYDDMQHLVRAILDGRISLRTEQHLRDHLARYGDMKSTEQPPAGVKLARDAVRRQFERSGDTGKQDPLQQRLERLQSWENVERLANEIRMASRIADVRAQRGDRHE